MTRVSEMVTGVLPGSSDLFVQDASSTYSLTLGNSPHSSNAAQRALDARYRRSSVRYTAQ